MARTTLKQISWRIRRAVIPIFVGLWGLLCAGARGQTFDVASVKVSAGGGISCSGTLDAGAWRCQNMPLALVIAKAFEFKAFEFSAHDTCCLSRFDFDVRFPVSTPPHEFNRMLQHLLRERFKFAFHAVAKDMPIYELTVGVNGLNMKPSEAGAPPLTDASWWSATERTFDGEGYPIFPAGKGGLASGPLGRYRWTAYNVSMSDIVDTLSEQLSRPVFDATRLAGKYDLDLKWVVKLDPLIGDAIKAQIVDEVGSFPDNAPGASLARAIQDQLGLKLVSKRGTGRTIVVDHVEKAPTRN